MTKWYSGMDEEEWRLRLQNHGNSMKWLYTPTALEKWRMAHIRARVQYERQIAQGVIAGLIFLVGVVVGRLL